MKRSEAVKIARRYVHHAEERRNYRKSGKTDLEQYHLGCMKMALQIFEEFSLSHGFGSPTHAISWKGEK